jgi:hypothetical protein
LGFEAMLRRTRRPLACVPILCTLVAVPTAALARTPHGGSGGSGIGTGGSSGSTTTTPYSATPTPGATAPGVLTLGGELNASGDGITLSVAASGTQGRPLALSGNAPIADAGQVIDLQSSKTGQDDWSQVATATIATNGTFSAQWTPGANGQLDLRAVLAPQVSSDDATSASGASGLSSGGSAAAAASEPSTSTLTIPIFKSAVATLYGPGFWGHRTACGQRLTHATLGVASRTLKCGTEVAVLYRGREITVPVIDRGPFANGASWDLTMATAKALGIQETATIGTLTETGSPLTAGH